MDQWAEKNGRRIRLIRKKHREALNPEETAELARLKREVSEHIKAVVARSTEVLAVIEEDIKRLKAKVAAKRWRNP